MKLKKSKTEVVNCQNTQMKLHLIVKFFHISHIYIYTILTNIIYLKDQEKKSLFFFFLHILWISSAYNLIWEQNKTQHFSWKINWTQAFKNVHKVTVWSEITLYGGWTRSALEVPSNLFCGTWDTHDISEIFLKYQDFMILKIFSRHFG